MPNLGVVGRRINAREVDPNPHITFTNVLENKPHSDAALKIMKALAAQVRPLMQKHGVKVNAFEEYPFNTVFAGRNWNAGEVVEIVLRRPDNSFLPMSYLERTLTHELAHCHEMNHGPRFQQLWSDLQGEVSELQRKGYYGDGFFSEGRRLGDSRPVSSAERHAGVVPELLCGGANARQAPSKSSRGYGRGLKRRRGQGMVKGEASLTSGAQTAKKRKASRVNARAFEDKEGGTRLDGQDGDEILDIKTVKAKITAATKRYQAADGLSAAAAKRAAISSLSNAERKSLETTTFGKRARTKSAAEQRAEAAEKRIKALMQSAELQVKKQEDAEETDDDVTEEEEDDEDAKDAEFGPDAVKRSFSGMLECDKEAMRDPFAGKEEEGTEDMGPESLEQVDTIEDTKLGSAASPRPVPKPKTAISQHTPSTSITAKADTVRPKSETPVRTTDTLQHNIIAHPLERLIKRETATSKLGRSIETSDRKLEDERFWRCSRCHTEWHPDYGKCGLPDCDGVNPKRQDATPPAVTKTNRAQSPIVISDDDEY